MNEQIPLARPDLGAREEELVLDVLRSGQLSLGPRLREFERAFAAWLGVDDAVAVSSGTAGLHLAVRALGWGEGDEVLTTPLSFVASSNCLLYEGATPVFCEIDPVTLNIDPASAEANAGERTAGILPVHIFGYPADLPALEALAESKGVPMLEDACQAPGALDSEGRRVGTTGNAASFAFYANKQLTTGEGGILIPDGTTMDARFRSERNQGRAPDMSQVDHPAIGFNYRMTDIQAALGIAQLERIDELLAARSAAAAAYTERLGSLGAPAGEGDPDGLVLPCTDRGDEERSWFVYAVQMPTSVGKEDVIEALGAEGIQAKAYLPCIHTMPPYRERFGFTGGEFPIAESVAARSVALPFFSSISEQQVERVCTALGSALVSAA
ncbi:MAG: DegT/DnrJ/EryC1/StrS family aminotransferase [Actinomycetota bacterium]|nr:DegT/DnrJ/EryC1/StrS family aminotransferase [Actinomycetota bacterium]